MYYKDEKACVADLLAGLSWDDVRAEKVKKDAAALIARTRASKRKLGELETFMAQYGLLDSEEGLALMTLAEALLRIPDAAMADELIMDKMSAAEWLAGQGKEGGDLLTKAAGFGMALTKKTLSSKLSKFGGPVIRKAMVEAMRILGKQFVLGRSIEEGLKNARGYEKEGYSLSYDMLGEGARTFEDAARYFEVYKGALIKIAEHGHAKTDSGRARLSVKLSALHPRYEYSHKEECVPALVKSLRELCVLAAEKDVCLTVDAEEADRLALSYEIIKEVFEDPALGNWEGLGVAVQAYQKRALSFLEDLALLAAGQKRRLRIRLVKGAYWDTEIKRAQVLGLSEYPVFTRKVNTDLSYLACAQKLLERRDVFYPMFATHNAQTIAAVREMASAAPGEGYEFQRLHGMGETVYNIVMEDKIAPVCVYAPCGSHEDLLPYLVRRLLENGANSSFVNKLLDQDLSPEDLADDPVTEAASLETARHPKIPLPRDIYGAARKNAKGLDLSFANDVGPVLKAIENGQRGRMLKALPFINGKAEAGAVAVAVKNPARHEEMVGEVSYATDAQIDAAFETALTGFSRWNKTPAKERAAALEKLADLLEEETETLMDICVREAGKTLPDALAEVREAVDFCRYYAVCGAKDFDERGTALPGPTGESNVLTLSGRGVFVCISPWNFPLAIFMGQISAALMAGNAVIAKPAEQTPLIAAKAVELMVKAGIDPAAISLLPGDGDVGAKIVGHKDVAGVAFTGSTEVARLINISLAQKTGPIVPLIAETGGQNAMVVDSSALTEQVVDDVILSAFGSAGQRCSALRVLYVQEDVAEKTIAMLKGAMKARSIGDPALLSTDIGPVIDQEAKDKLEAHRAWLDKNGHFIAALKPDKEQAAGGFFFAPVAYEIRDITELDGEHFGPILHVVRYKHEERDAVIKRINATGYGLTFGVHSRVSSVMEGLSEEADVGNVYVNRSMIGAVVGVQPFGGHGLSGTGPKAGGPHYLYRFATEKVVSIDTTRQGGNASLVSLEE